MRAGGLLGWGIFATAAVLVWYSRGEMDPQKEALQRTVDMVRAEYPGARVLQQTSVPSAGKSGTAAIVVFSQAGESRERRVYVDYKISCDQDKPGCMQRRNLVWDYQDPEFLAQASARAGQYY